MNYKKQLKRTKETNHFMLHNNIKATMLTEDQARDGPPVSLNAMETLYLPFLCQRDDPVDGIPRHNPVGSDMSLPYVFVVDNELLGPTGRIYRTGRLSHMRKRMPDGGWEWLKNRRGRHVYDTDCKKRGALECTFILQFRD